MYCGKVRVHPHVLSMCACKKELHWVRRVWMILRSLRCRCKEPGWLVCGACVFVRYASTGFVQCACENGFEQGSRVNEIVRVNVGFYAVHAHERFVQCVSTMSLCPCSVLVWDQHGSWAGACESEVMCFVLVCRSVYRGAHVQEPAPQYGPPPPGFVPRASVLVQERV